jgi:hypothetical protein
MIPKLKKHKRLRRRISLPEGAFVLTVDNDGIHLRAAGKQTGVRVPYDALALAGLECERYTLTDDDRQRPLETLGSLYRRQRA